MALTFQMNVLWMTPWNMPWSGPVKNWIKP